VLAVEHQLAVLVADRGPGGHLASAAVRGQSGDLQLRVERVTGVDLGEERAADAGEGGRGSGVKAFPSKIVMPSLLRR